MDWIPGPGVARNARPKDVERRDIVRAYAVEIAISITGLIGIRQAAIFLRKYAVDIDVALRVLLYPARRRKYSSLDIFALEEIVPDK